MPATSATIREIRGVSTDKLENVGDEIGYDNCQRQGHLLNFNLSPAI